MANKIPDRPTKITRQELDDWMKPSHQLGSVPGHYTDADGEYDITVAGEDVTIHPTTYHLCSIKVRTGEQEYVIYELRDNITGEEYTRETLEFCLHTSGATARQSTDDDFAEWAYDDRLYCDPWVQDVTKAEYDVLRRYLHCR